MDEMSRRQFMEVVAASAAAGIVLPASASTPAVTAASDALSASQMDALTAMLDRLIPADGQMPAAGALGIAAFIQAAVAAAPHFRSHIDVALAAAAEVQTSPESGADPGQQLDVVLQRLERDQHESFDLLLQAAYTGYYSHPKVLAALRWVDPSDESQHQLPPFDATLLAAVRRRAGIPDIA
jgi:hypothetical protein